MIISSFNARKKIGRNHRVNTPRPDKSQTVLIIDDDADIAAGASIQLSSVGFTTSVANNGEEGVKVALEMKPSVIVMDVRMPKKDGLSALADLQANPGTCEIPIVMLSASIIDQARSLDAGARFFVSKPYRADDLLSAVNAAIYQ